SQARSGRVTSSRKRRWRQSTCSGIAMGAAGSEDSPRMRSIADLSSGMYIGPSPLIGPDFRKKNPVQTETGAQLDRIITFRDEVDDKSPGAIGFDPGNCRVHDFALAGGY